MSVISFTDQDIEYAESILLKAGQKFDEERVEFLKDLNTLDLQAVPGSGKTTALLAKLLIFERYMPFKDGSGILVISHTNAAIDEIKNRIGSYCPKLFSYPNFVGTIQSFVNEFLAKPYISQKFKIQVSKVDTNLFENHLLRKFKLIAWNDDYGKPTSFFWGRNIKKAEKETINTNGNKKEICNREIDKEIKNLYFDYSDNQIKLFTDKKCLLKDPTNKKYQGLKKIIENTIKDGFLSFEYAYIFANDFLKNNDCIQKLLQQRFRFIFVDEMQDMDKHQYQILEMLFFDKGLCKSVYQRIGDKNQAIFNGEVKLDEIWIDRITVKKIAGSHRLSPQIANLTNQFSLTNCNIKGLNLDSKIKPQMLVYTHENKEKLIQYYKSLINQLTKEGLLPNSVSEIIAAVAWVTGKKDNETKITLPSYYPSYSREQEKPKSEYNCLAQYLVCFEQTNNSLKPIAANIKNAILKSLRIVNIKDDDGKFFKETTFNLLLQEKSLFDERAAKFEKKIYEWSINVMKGKHEIVLVELQTYIISIFSEIFPNSTPNKDFLYGEYVLPIIEVIPSKIVGCDVLLNTVHAVKGHTHLSTLYLESFYDGEYESTLMSEVFSGINSIDLISNVQNEIKVFNEDIVKLKESGKIGGKTKLGKIKKLETKINNIKKYSKMLYVGFSRPTHLLAFAVEENRFKDLNINRDIWDVTLIDDL
jgi:DNA helicase-2/ATP-dependent DNA helicase PcrA